MMLLLVTEELERVFTFTTVKSSFDDKNVLD